MISFNRQDIGSINLENFSIFKEINVFQIPAWLEFVSETQIADPVIASINSNGDCVGYFIGLIVKKFGIKILGSPFRGWTTYFMGFNLRHGISRYEVLNAFPEFAFNELGCHYLEIVDPLTTKNDCDGLSYKRETLNWFAMDLTMSEEELFSNMKHACRTNIRKAQKNGVLIEETEEITFAEEYYTQLEDVLESKSLAPPYNLDTVRNLIEKVSPTGNLLLLRANNPEGICIATGIFLALNEFAVFWGAASLKQYQHLRPNELLAWYGIKRLKSQGYSLLHWGGLNERYKKKFGCYEIELQRLMMAKNYGLRVVLDIATSPNNIGYRNWMLRRL